ncbi:hypothetical protein Cme02nite_40730 [Catellatospora methionotrophica]|uniref:Uncharacterized protein n=1 Tax=Catellatospora methionotrophica TaxID=121620 RepID=A0A8J3LIF2_9ACTN|nr:hypothetical protein Cme02nite_40730 [Catellatospora methionotrophica]
MRGEQLRLHPGGDEPGRGQPDGGGAELGGEHWHPTNLAARTREPARHPRGGAGQVDVAEPAEPKAGRVVQARETG